MVDKKSSPPLHVVGIGASAGGLEALQELFDGIPDNTGAAFVVVQHLSPDYKSMMPELLKKHTEMPIQVVKKGTELAADNIYLIPARKNMQIVDNKLTLSEQMQDTHRHMTIDIFLCSLAEDQQYKGIGIVLSGTGSDGSRGIQAIKGSGGLAIVQEPASAKFDGMPRSAINTGLVDMILKPKDVGDNLVNYMQHPAISANMTSFDGELNNNNDILHEILQLLKLRSSINFAFYKMSTVSRRIERRLGVNQLTSLESYLRLLLESPREVQILSKDLLIGVTRFFRDEQCFKRLQLEVIPSILRDHPNPREPIRIWVAGCSTGEEAYSIAMLFDQAISEESEEYSVKVFATDVDEDAIAEASSGRYAMDIEQDVPAEFMEQYFERNGEQYEVHPRIRKSVIFAIHNMLEDPPFSNLNLVSCRNTLIYFQVSAQQKVFSSFYFALNMNAYLFLGGSESLGSLQSHFATIDDRNKLFQKVTTDKIPLSQTNMDQRLNTAVSTTGFVEADNQTNMVSRGYSVDRFDGIKDKLLERYAPHSIILNDAFEAVHVYGNVNEYTQRLKPGRVSNQIQDIVLDELSVAVSTALQRAKKTNEDVFYKDVTFTSNDTKKVVNITVFVVKQSEHPNAPRTYVLQFVSQSDDKIVSNENSITFDAEEQSQQRIQDLELELLKKQEHLQVTVEELETTNEELQAANEELMSANEELQSTNEELQSVNEELYTVNSEYQEKIQQLTEANSDLDNVINATDIGIIFLDEQLTIRKFTPHAKNYVNVRSADLGRPINHLSHELGYEEFLSDIGKVSQSGDTIEKDVYTTNGHSVLLRILPYHVKEHDVANGQGVVITLTDISRIKHVENALDQAKIQFKSLLLERSDHLQHRIERNENVNILLVDDNAVDREDASRMLKKLSNRVFSVMESDNVTGALSILSQTKIDICLLDYKLEQETAEDFTLGLRQSGYDIPVILLSSLDEVAMNTQFLDNEVIDVISKDGLSGELLARSIDYVLERQQLKAIVANLAN